MEKRVQVNIRNAREGGAKDDAEPVLDIFLVFGKLVTCLFLAVAFTSFAARASYWHASFCDMYPF